MLITVGGIEPPASCSQSRRSAIELHHGWSVQEESNLRLVDPNDARCRYAMDRWSPETGSNRRPAACRAAILPLNYPEMGGGSRWSRTTASKRARFTVGCRPGRRNNSQNPHGWNRTTVARISDGGPAIGRHAEKCMSYVDGFEKEKAPGVVPGALREEQRWSAGLCRHRPVRVRPKGPLGTWKMFQMIGLIPLRKSDCGVHGVTLW